MKKTLLLTLALTLFTLGAQALRIPVYLPLSVTNYNLVVGRVGYVEVKACNSLSSVLIGTSISVTSNNTLVLNVTAPIGKLLPGKCRTTKIYLIPSKATVYLKLLATGYSPLLKGLVQGTASIALRVKAPQLIVKSKPLSYPNPLELEITNVGNAVFDGKVYLYLNGKVVTWKWLVIKPGESKELKLKVPPLPKGSWSGVVRFTMTQFSILKKITIKVLKSPIKFEVNGSKIRYCSPIPLTLTISSSSGTPSPEKVIILKCGSFNYLVENPKLPFTVTFKLSSPYFDLVKKLTVNDIEIKSNTTTIFSNSQNIVTLRLLSSVPIIGYVSFSSNSPINPASSVVRINGTITISVIGTNNPTVVKVSAFGKEYELRFNVIKYLPVISFYVKPNILVEGSISRVKVCVKNVWMKTLKDLTLAVTKPVNAQTFIPSLAPGQSSCLQLNVTVPWGSKEVTIVGYAQGLGFKKEFKYNLLVAPSSYVAILTVSSNKNFLNVGINNVTLTIKNIGKGWAKGVKLEFDAPDLVAPTQFYLGNLKPYGEKKIKLEFLIPPSKKKEDLKVKVSFCSGPLEGPCIGSKQSFSLFFGIHRYLPPLLQLNAPITLASGKTNHVIIIVKNVGKSKAIAPTVTFSNGKYVSITGPNVFALKDVPPGKELKLNVTLSVQATFTKKRDSISYELKYSDEWGNEYTKEGSLVFELKPVNEAKVVVNLLTSKVPVGNSMLKFIISNIGTKAAKGVTVTIYADGIAVKKEKFIIQALGPKQSVQLLVPISAPPSAVGSSVSVGVAVSYDGHTDSFSYNVEVVRGPQISITDLSVAPQTLRPSMTGTISFGIANTGDQPAYGVTAKVYLPLQLSALGPTSVIVGIVKQQSVVPIAFLFKVKEAKPGTYPIKIVISYSYQGIRYKKEISTTVIIKPKTVVIEQGLTSFISRHPLLTAVGALIVLIVVLVSIRKFVRKRRATEEGEAIDVE